MKNYLSIICAMALTGCGTVSKVAEVFTFDIAPPLPDTNGGGAVEAALSYFVLIGLLFVIAGIVMLIIGLKHHGAISIACGAACAAVAYLFEAYAHYVVIVGIACSISYGSYRVGLKKELPK